MSATAKSSGGLGSASGARAFWAAREVAGAAEEVEPVGDREEGACGITAGGLPLDDDPGAVEEGRELAKPKA